MAHTVLFSGDGTGQGTCSSLWLGVFDPCGLWPSRWKAVLRDCPPLPGPATGQEELQEPAWLQGFFASSSLGRGPGP